jgi:predicted O-linked N-acetylglucosamine transferase (SPINDLY family)
VIDDVRRTSDLFEQALRHYRAGRLTAAERLCRCVLSVDAAQADGWHRLGVIAGRSGRLAEAARLIGRATVLQGGVAEFRASLALALQSQGKIADAISHYEMALDLGASDANTFYNLGTALRALGRLREAAARYEQSLRREPAFPEALANLGAIRKELGQLREAIDCFLQALCLHPTAVATLYNLGNALAEIGRTDEALSCYRRTTIVQPRFAAARWAFAMTQIPLIYRDGREPDRCFAAFEDQLGELERWFDADPPADGHTLVGNHQPFFLAYQDKDNRSVLARHGALCGKLMSAWEKPPLPPPAAFDGRRAVRVGIVSRYVYDHPVWRALVDGWLRHLDRRRFALTVFHLGAAKETDSVLDHVPETELVAGRVGLASWVQAIGERRPDVLLYPEIGMDVMTAKLANLRLAPVQMASWGHPETTGLPTIDYYLSADDLEPPDAGKAYTETLVRLPHLGCCTEELAVPAIPFDPGSWGLDENAMLVVCAGTPFKYAPQHDWVFPAIAKTMARGKFLFFTYKTKDLSDILATRLAASFADAGLTFADHVVFLPFLPRPAFFGLLRRADLYLDTIGFSGFNTALQAVECGLPIVTCEGRFLRGRLASGILNRMNLAELVATSPQDFVAKAVRLVSDSEYRGAISKRMAQSRRILYDDVAPIRAMEDVILGALRQNLRYPATQ